MKECPFHDLRHCAVNSFRLKGNDYFRTMTISGHKTMSVFKRHYTVTEDELRRVKWRGGQVSMDTYLDTIGEEK